MQITETINAVEDFSIREGQQKTRVMLMGKEGSLNNYRVQLTYAETDCGRAARHRHNFEQLRFPLEGEFVYAKDQLLSAGEVGYFPESSFYGPQMRKQGLLMLVCQFGGASGNGYMSKQQRKVAYDQLAGEGQFEDGMYTYVDADGKRHRQDGHEIVWERAMGRKMTYNDPRYNDTITMSPRNYDWMERADAPGVADKWLGTFTERNTRAGFIRIDRGATLNAGMHGAPEIMFLVSGSVSCGDKIYPRHSAFGFEANEGPIPILAKEPSEFYCVQMPVFKNQQ